MTSGFEDLPLGNTCVPLYLSNKVTNLRKRLKMCSSVLTTFFSRLFRSAGFSLSFSVHIKNYYTLFSLPKSFLKLATRFQQSLVWTIKQREKTCQPVYQQHTVKINPRRCIVQGRYLQLPVCQMSNVTHLATCECYCRQMASATGRWTFALPRG